MSGSEKKMLSLCCLYCFSAVPDVSNKSDIVRDFHY